MQNEDIIKMVAEFEESEQKYYEKRSTFGTSTELLNSLRLMFSRLASHRCPNGHYHEPTLAVAAEQELVCPVCGIHFYAPGAEELSFNSKVLVRPVTEQGLCGLSISRLLFQMNLLQVLLIYQYLQFRYIRNLYAPNLRLRQNFYWGLYEVWNLHA